ncbi:hypothetical protein JMJ55_27720 [Belnapia sp. T6]|uniref:Uncharacterized protein n=1 Tax=Belnapia mucosa TaxID=2804532 RepID=A0ABS1VBW8_9PROT|nr:hypothetical protein [Belnapia mucosa]MBL6459117.1 hypothetical protein [Belnapia mucosa]
MLLMSELRQAACDEGDFSFAFGGGDASELVALVSQIADRERCTVDFDVTQGSPGLITARFVRRSHAIANLDKPRQSAN